MAIAHTHVGLSWHQQRAAGLHALPYDIMGWAFAGSIYCTDCYTESDADRLQDSGEDIAPVFRDQLDSLDYTETCENCGRELVS